MRYVVALPVCVLLVSGALWLLPRENFQGTAQEPFADASLSGEKSLTAPKSFASAAALDAPRRQSSGNAADPIVVGPCTLLPIQEQQVSSQLDGVLREVPVVLGQQVKKGDVLARLDEQKLRLQIELLRIQAASASAERIAKALYDEAHAKVVYAEQANSREVKAVPELEYKTYLAQRERFAQEISKAREDRQTAEKELEKAQHLLRLHAITSALEGEVVKLFHKEGENVRQAEPLFRIARMDRLLIEGYCKVQHAGGLTVGTRVNVEPELQGSQIVELVGHTRAITCLAISADGRTIVSGSEDGTAALWSWPDGRRRAILTHPAAVQAVAIFQKGESQIVVTGCEDKVARAWEFLPSGEARGPLLEMQGHGGTIRCVAIGPDGKMCATGGDDHRIALWDLESGARRAWVHGLGALKQAAHQGAITSLQITPDNCLVSAGRDNALRVWSLSGEGAKLMKSYRDRSGDLPRLAVSPDGKSVLFDHGDELRILERDSGNVLGRVESAKNIRFKEFACFSSSARLIVVPTADGTLHLWRNPSDSMRGFEVRNYRLPRAIEARCGVVAPDEKAFFTAGTDRLVRAWAIPQPSEWEPRRATLTFVGNEIAPGTDLVRIQAEMENPEGQKEPLRPGTFVTLKIAPR